MATDLVVQDASSLTLVERCFQLKKPDGQPNSSEIIDYLHNHGFQRLEGISNLVKWNDQDNYERIFEEYFKFTPMVNSASDFLSSWKRMVTESLVSQFSNLTSEEIYEVGLQQMGIESDVGTLANAIANEDIKAFSILALDDFKKIFPDFPRDDKPEKERRRVQYLKEWTQTISMYARSELERCMQLFGIEKRAYFNSVEKKIISVKEAPIDEINSKGLEFSMRNLHPIHPSIQEIDVYVRGKPGEAYTFIFLQTDKDLMMYSTNNLNSSMNCRVQNDIHKILTTGNIPSSRQENPYSRLAIYRKNKLMADFLDRWLPTIPILVGLAGATLGAYLNVRHNTRFNYETVIRDVLGTGFISGGASHLIGNKCERVFNARLRAAHEEYNLSSLPKNIQANYGAVALLESNLQGHNTRPRQRRSLQTTSLK